MSIEEKSNSLYLLGKKEILFPLVIFCLVGISFAAFILPRVREILSLRTAIIDQEKEINNLSQKVVDLKSLSEAELFDSANLLVEAYPDKKDFYNLLVVVKNIYQKSGCNLDAFEFSPGVISSESAVETKTDQASYRLSLKNSFSCSFENLETFVKNLETALPLMTIDSLSYLKEKIASESGSFSEGEGKLTIAGYFRPLPKALGTVDKALPKITSQDQKLIEKLRSYYRYQPEVIFEGSVTVGRDDPFPP